MLPKIGVKIITYIELILDKTLFFELFLKLRGYRLSLGLSYRASGGLLAGEPGGRAALSITPYMNRAGYCRQRNYYSKFTLL
jgi:hypothetical protein